MTSMSLTAPFSSPLAAPVSPISAVSRSSPSGEGWAELVPLESHSSSATAGVAAAATGERGHGYGYRKAGAQCHGAPPGEGRT